MNSLANLKILVVEDDESLFNFQKRWLMLEDCNFIGSLTGEGGIALFKKNPDTSLVILDMVLPDISGKEVFHEIRKLNPDIPVIICSGYHDKIKELSGQSNVQLLYKPFQVARCKEMIEKACGRAC